MNLPACLNPLGCGIGLVINLLTGTGGGCRTCSASLAENGEKTGENLRTTAGNSLKGIHKNRDGKREAREMAGYGKFTFLGKISEHVAELEVQLLGRALTHP